VVDTLDLALRQPTASLARYGFVFADLRAHGRGQTVPADAGAALRGRFRGLVTAAARRHGALDLTPIGDGYYLLLPSPRAALRCARSIVTSAAETPDGAEPLRVAVGVHAGDAEASARGPLDGPGHLAARIGAVAPIGEVHVTGAVVDLAGRTAGIRFEPRTLPPLKGLARPPSVYAAVGETGAVGAGRMIRVLAMGSLAGLLSLTVMAGFGGAALVSPSAGLDTPDGGAAGGTVIASPPVDLVAPGAGGVNGTSGADPDPGSGPVATPDPEPPGPIRAPIHLRLRFR
jgi:hypothetical protein